MRESSNSIQDLFAAVQRSDIEQVKQLVASGIALDQKDENGQTVLTVASSIGDADMMNLLITAGANVNVEPEPLVLNPRISIMERPNGPNLADLIAQATTDAPEEAKQFYSGFLSILEAFSGSSNQSLNSTVESEIAASQSLDKGEDKDEDELDEDENELDEDEDEDELDDEDEASTPLEAAVLNGDINTVKMLLQAGANPNPTAWYETPVLVKAVRKGNVELVQLLIDAKANVDRGINELPLHTAAEEGHLEVVRLLLDSGADVEGYEEDYWTALMEASSTGHLPIVQLLVERGANVNAWSQGATPLMLAASGVHREVYEFLYPLVSEEIRAIGDRDAEKEIRIM